MKDESGTLCKMWAVPNKEIFRIFETLGLPGINSTPFEVFSQCSECSYEYRDDLGFHIPHPVNFDLQILVFDNFSASLRAMFLSAGTETSIRIQDLEFLS